MEPDTYYSDAPDIDQLVSDGIAAVKANRRTEARELLMQVVEWDETHSIAWLWLSSVVDDLEEKEICLENVLMLEPNNQAAQRGLEVISRQKELHPQPSPEPQTPTQQNRTTTSKYKRLPPGGTRPAPAIDQETIQSTTSEPIDEYQIDPLENELGCPYCAAPTEPEHKKCPKCRKKLIISIPRKAKTSILYKVILVLQGLNIAQYLLIGIGALLSISFMGDLGEAPGEEVIPPGIITLIILIALLPGLIYASFIFIGFLKRWPIVYYLTLFQSIMFFIGAVVLGVTFGLDSSVGLGCGGAIIVIALAQLFMVLNLGDDFALDRFRIMLHADSDIKTAENFLSRGNLYAKRKMWAMAAIHFRRAAMQMPNNINGHMALVLAYLNLGMHDKIQASLDQAKRLNSDDPALHQLIEDIKKQSPA